MEKSANFEKVKAYYETISPITNQRLWSIEKVRRAVGKWITVDEYEIITGQSYPS